MKNSLTYLTRRCPRNCEYCALRDAKDIGKELTIEQWVEAFEVLHKLKVEFNLILGNETWLLGEGMLDILKTNKVAYALYTTCPEPFFKRYRDLYFDSGYLDNLSCGIDYPPTKELNIDDDSYLKSKAAWDGFLWVREHFPSVDTQGTITVHKKNIEYVKDLVDSLTSIGVFVGINFIHWNKDGKYDFFPTKDEISDLLFTPEDYPMVRETLQSIVNDPGLLQNPEFINVDPSILLNMGWHCQGNPYGGPTIDADGQLRCCGYRRGEYTPKLSIFDLPERIEEWRGAVYKDAMACPGCAWSYPWMFRYWENKDSNMGRQVFVRHAGKDIPEVKWSKRKVE